MDWIIDPVIDDSFNISNNNPLAGSSYIKLWKELDYPPKKLINNQNTDNNECFEWFLVRYLHPADYNLRIIREVDKLYGNKLDLKDIKFPVKVKDISKNEGKNSISISFFGYKNEKGYPISRSKKCCEEKYADLLFIGEEGKTQYFWSIYKSISVVIFYKLLEKQINLKFLI